MGEPWMLASCHIMAHTTDWVAYLVCRSFSHSEKLCMGPPKFTKPAPVTSHMGIRCRWVGPNSSRKDLVPRRGQCNYVLQCLLLLAYYIACTWSQFPDFFKIGTTPGCHGLWCLWSMCLVDMTPFLVCMLVFWFRGSFVFPFICHVFFYFVFGFLPFFFNPADPQGIT